MPDVCAATTKRFFWKIKFAQCCQLQNSIVRQNFGVHTVTLGRPSLCDPNLQSPFLSLRRSSARRSLRLLKASPRPALLEPSVPALPARKRKRVRPQGRPRAAGSTKAARRIHRLKTTLVPGPIPWLLRKAVADIDIVFGGGCTLREHGPRSNPGPLLFYGCAVASSEQSSGLPPRLTHARNRHPKRAATYSKNARSRKRAINDPNADADGPRTTRAASSRPPSPQSHVRSLMPARRSWTRIAKVDTGIAPLLRELDRRADAVRRSAVYYARSGDLTAVVAQPAGEFCK